MGGWLVKGGVWGVKGRCKKGFAGKLNMDCIYRIAISAILLLIVAAGYLSKKRLAKVIAKDKLFRGILTKIGFKNLGDCKELLSFFDFRWGG